MNHNTSTRIEPDKYNLVLDIIGHPDNYSPAQLAMLLSDSETREIYNLLCKTASAAKASRPVDIDAEWQAFSERHRAKRSTRFPVWLGGRAAAIVTIALSSLAAVAIGVAVTVTISDRKAADASEKVFLSETTPSSAAPVSVSPQSDTIAPHDVYILFEDATLREITDSIAKVHNLQITFGNKEAADLHLYYRFYPALPLDETISRLNTFEQINITRNGNVLNID